MKKTNKRLRKMIFPEYSQKMTLADLSKSKSLISIDIPMILKTEGE